MERPWAKAMDEIDVIRAQEMSRGASRMLEDIAAGTRTAMHYSLDESLIYICRSTRRPDSGMIAKLASDSSYSLMQLEIKCRDPGFRMNCYALQGKNFTVGIYEHSGFPKEVALSHTLNHSEGMLELLDKVAELYGVVYGTKASKKTGKNVPVDDVGLHGERTAMPKPFQDFLKGLRF